jgi:hypothetical protein
MHIADSGTAGRKYKLLFTRLSFLIALVIFVGGVWLLENPMAEWGFGLAMLPMLMWRHMVVVQYRCACCDGIFASKGDAVSDMVELPFRAYFGTRCGICGNASGGGTSDPGRRN